MRREDNDTDHDVISGGGGGGDLISIGYGDDADGGVGSDTLILSPAEATAGVTVGGNFATGTTVGGGTIKNIEFLSWVHGSQHADAITIPTQSTQPVNTLVEGGGDDDNLNGSGSGVSLFGGDGNDTLVGGSASDKLEGGQGSDTISGRDGDDIIQFASSWGKPSDVVRGKRLTVERGSTPSRFLIGWT